MLPFQRLQHIELRTHPDIGPDAVRGAGDLDVRMVALEFLQGDGQRLVCQSVATVPGHSHHPDDGA